MKKAYRLLIITFGVGLSFLLGMAAGFKQGVENSGMLFSITDGALSSTLMKLSEIKKGNYDHINFDHEFRIDGAIYSFSQFERKGNKILSEQFMPEAFANREKHMSKLAEYRKDHPMLWHTDPEWEAWRNQEIGLKIKEIKTTLREHGVPESALSTYATEYFK